MKEKTKPIVQQQSEQTQQKEKTPWLFDLEVKDLIHPITIRRVQILQVGILVLVLVAAGYFSWKSFLQQPTGQEVVADMIEAAGGMETWNNITDGQFTRTQYLYSESGEALSQKIQTFFFKKTDSGLKLMIKSINENGEEVWVGEDKEGHWATKGEEAADPKKTARDLGMMCDSKFCQPSCATSMAFFRFSMPFKLTDQGVIPTLTGKAPLGDKEAYVLDISYDPKVGKDRWVFFVDPQDKLIRKIEYHNKSDKGHPRPEDMYWSDYQEESGITFSHKWTRYWSNGQVLEEFIYSDIDFETEIPIYFFDRPEGHEWITAVE